jgi:hypothetical protein
MCYGQGNLELHFESFSPISISVSHYVLSFAALLSTSIYVRLSATLVSLHAPLPNSKAEPIEVTFSDFF